MDFTVYEGDINQIAAMQPDLQAVALHRAAVELVPPPHRAGLPRAVPTEPPGGAARAKFSFLPGCLLAELCSNPERLQRGWNAWASCSH